MSRSDSFFSSITNNQTSTYSEIVDLNKSENLLLGSSVSSFHPESEVSHQTKTQSDHFIFAHLQTFIIECNFDESFKEQHIEIPLPSAPKLKNLMILYQRVEKIVIPLKSKTKLPKPEDPPTLSFKNERPLLQYPELDTFSTNFILRETIDIGSPLMTSCTFSGSSIHPNTLFRSPKLVHLDFAWFFSKRPSFWEPTMESFQAHSNIENAESIPKNGNFLISMGTQTVKTPYVPVNSAIEIKGKNSLNALSGSTPDNQKSDFHPHDQNQNQEIIPVVFNSLEKLIIRFPKFYKVPTTIFGFFPNLKSMQLYGRFKFFIIGANDEKNFHELFSNLTELKLLASGEPSVKKVQIPREQFVSSLKSVSFSNCLLRDIPLADSLPNIESLNLSRNKITKIRNDIKLLQSLRFLNLSRNRIKILPVELFTLSQLTHLSLAHNLINTLPSDISLLQELTHLDCSHNNLNFIPDLKLLNKLVLIRFANNSLTSTVFTKVSTLSKLRVIDFGFNRLQILPSKLNKLYPDLTKFYANSNMLRHVPSRLFLSPKIKRVDFSVNLIPKIPETLGIALELEYVQFERNQIETIPLNIGMLSKLRVLKLGFNNIKKLPVTLMQCTSLVTLDLSNNKLTSLPRNIGNLKNLERLLLTCNQITSLPDSFKMLKNLQEESSRRGYFFQTTQFSFGVYNDDGNEENAFPPNTPEVESEQGLLLPSPDQENQKNDIATTATRNKHSIKVETTKILSEPRVVKQKVHPISNPVICSPVESELLASNDNGDLYSKFNLVLVENKKNPTEKGRTDIVSQKIRSKNTQSKSGHTGGSDLSRMKRQSTSVSSIPNTKQPRRDGFGEQFRSGRRNKTSVARLEKEGRSFRSLSKIKPYRPKTSFGMKKT